MARGWSRGVDGVLLLLATVACAGERIVHSNEPDTGGSSTGGTTPSGGASGASAGGGTGGTNPSGGGTAGNAAGAPSGGTAGSSEPYGMFVYASTVGAMVDYPNAVASRIDAEIGGMVRIMGTISGDDWTEGYTSVYVTDPSVGTFPCVNDLVYLGTLQVCCGIYESRNTPGGPDCQITLTEVGGGAGTDIAGTFEGWTHDINGGRMRLQNGRFRARFEN